MGFWLYKKRCLLSIIYLDRSGCMPLTRKWWFWYKWIGYWKLDKKFSSWVSFKIFHEKLDWNCHPNKLNDFFLVILFPFYYKILCLNYISFHQILSITLNSILRKNWLWETFLKKNLENHKKSWFYFVS